MTRSSLATTPKTARGARADRAVKDDERVEHIQQDARLHGKSERPRWPMIVLRSPKGWTGPKVVDVLKIEGTFRSHQIPISDPSTQPGHLKLWKPGSGATGRRSYKEEGTVTTPFDMTVLNDLDRFHLVMDAIDRLPQTGAAGVDVKQQLKDKLVEHKQYIDKYGQDLPEVRDWKWGQEEST